MLLLPVFISTTSRLKSTLLDLDLTLTVPSLIIPKSVSLLTLLSLLCAFSFRRLSSFGLSSLADTYELSGLSIDWCFNPKNIVLLFLFFETWVLNAKLSIRKFSSFALIKLFKLSSQFSFVIMYRDEFRSSTSKFMPFGSIKLSSRLTIVSKKLEGV